MPGPPSKFTHEIALDPAAAKKKFLRAFEDSKCEMSATAKALEIGNVVTCYRIAKRLELSDKLAAVDRRAREEGWHYSFAKGPRVISPEGRAKIAASQRKRRARERRGEN